MPCPKLSSKYCLFKIDEKPASVVWSARRKGELITFALFPAEGSFCEIDEACSTPREVKGGPSWEKSLVTLWTDSACRAMMIWEAMSVSVALMYQVTEKCIYTSLNGAVKKGVVLQD